MIKFFNIFNSPAPTLVRVVMLNDDGGGGMNVQMLSRQIFL